MLISNTEEETEREGGREGTGEGGRGGREKKIPLCKDVISRELREWERDFHATELTFDE